MDLDLAQQIRDIDVFENGITYLLYLTAPINVVMVTVGFLYRGDCPGDVRLPRYLFFGGLAGLMATLLRIVMELKWRSMNKKQGNIKSELVLDHGLLSELRRLNSPIFVLSLLSPILHVHVDSIPASTLV